MPPVLLAFDPQRLAAWLLENGADPNAVDTAGETAMHAAIDHGNAAAAAVISRKGGDLALERLSDGLTSVELAIESGDVRCRRFLSGGFCPAASVWRMAGLRTFRLNCSRRLGISDCWVHDFFGPRVLMQHVGMRREARCSGSPRSHSLLLAICSTCDSKNLDL